MKNKIKKQSEKSIAKSVSITLLIISIIIFLITGFIILNRIYAALIKSLDEKLLDIAKGLKSHTDIDENGIIKLDITDVFIFDFGKGKNNSYFLVNNIDDNYEILRSPSLEWINLINLKNDLEDSYFFYEKINDRKIRFYAYFMEIKPDPEDFPDINNLPEAKKCLFVIGEDVRQLQLQFYRIMILTVVSLSIGLVLLLVSGWYTLANNLKPIFIFKDEVEEINENNLIPVSVPVVIELKNVAETLNVVINNLKSAFEREKRFTSSVAHELRTPISEIINLTEVILKYSKNIAKNHIKNYNDILYSAKYMQKIVQSLLILSRIDANILNKRHQSFSLNNLINQIIAKYDKIYKSKKISINLKMQKNISVKSDEEIMSIIIDNLVSNAFEYSPSQSEIIIDIDSKSFSISNTIIDLTKEDLPSIFERFWRKDKSRSTNDNHCGLGLSLVRSLTEFLNIEVYTELVLDKLKFTLSGF